MKTEMTQATSNSKLRPQVISHEQHAENRRLATAEMGLPASKRQKSQVKKYGPRKVEGKDEWLKVEVRWDDKCWNGVNSFSVTGELFQPYRSPGEPCITMDGKRYWLGSCGCLHDEIAVTFPELREAISYHGMMADGPMHYLANTVFLAGDRDHWGQRKGDVERSEYGVRFGDSPVTHRVKHSLWKFIKERMGTGEWKFTICSFAHDRDPETFSPYWTLTGYGERWHECPFHDETAAAEFCLALNTCEVEFVEVPVAWSEGKARELDAARRAACWPEATDEELSQEPGALKAVLLARLPELMERFKVVVEGLGMEY